MADTLLLLAASAAAYFGFALLALSQSRHWQQVLPGHGPQPPRLAALRLSGSAALAIALAPCLIRDGTGFGIVLWLLQLSVAAPALVFTLSWRPHWLQRLARRLAGGATPASHPLNRRRPMPRPWRRQAAVDIHPPSQPFASQSPPPKDADDRECEQDPDAGRAAGVGRWPRTG